jgi:hypothetical protein
VPITRAYDPQRFTEAMAHAGRPSRIAAFAELLETLPPSGFRRVLEQVLRLPSDDRDPMLMHLLFQAWQRADRAGAIAALATIPDQTLRSAAKTVLARAWARSDVAGARAWAEKNLHMAQLMSFKKYADQLEGRVEAPKTSIDQILKNPDRAARERELTQFIRNRAKEAPLAAANLLGSIPEKSERDSAAFALVIAWKDQDAMAAARWFISPEARKLGIADTNLTWFVAPLAEQNPSGSLDLIRSLDFTAGFERLFAQQLLSAVYDKDPKAVVAMLQDPQFDRADFPERYRVLAKHDPEAAFRDAIEKLRADNSPENRRNRRNAAIFVAEETAKKNPAEAARLATTAPPELFPSLFGEIGEIWAKTDAAAAGEWAAKLPPGAARDDASREFAFHWAQHDATRCAAWLDAIPKGSSRDEAIFGFACASMDLDPDAALAWVRNMTNAQRRDFALARAWQIWSRKNPGAATNWLENQPTLNEAERERIQTQE